jgi:ribosomal protein L19E
MAVDPQKNNVEKIRALENELARLRIAKCVIERNIEEYYVIIKSEPYAKERLTKKIEYYDEEMDIVKAKIKRISTEIELLQK